MRARYLLTALGLGAILAGDPGVRDAAAAPDILLMLQVNDFFAKDDAAAGFQLLEAAILNPGTPPADKLDLLTELAARRLKSADYADAGEALALKADLVGRLSGSAAPEIGGLLAAAADAYVRAGEPARALALAQTAIRSDSVYYPCDDTVIGRDHARLAEILMRIGDKAGASLHHLLADDPAARCAESGGTAGSRGIIVSNDSALAATADSFARVKVFYATDRASTDSDRPDEYYGGDRGALDYGVVEVTVPRIHKPGEIEAPSLVRLEWSENPARHFVITGLKTMSSNEMFAVMRETIDAGTSDEAFVFIHGFNVTFADAAKRTAQIAYDINFDGIPILFSWPSEGRTFSYTRDEAVVRLSGRRLLHFLDDLAAYSDIGSINIIAHSMGNRALIDALELLAVRRAAAGLAGPVLNQVIFAAPDEDAALFFEMVGSIQEVARRLTLYASDADVALEISLVVHGNEPRAGQGKPMFASKSIDSIDMSALGEDLLGHSYFADNASALTDMLWLFWQDTPPGKRCGMDARPPQGLSWQFDPGRCNGPALLSALTLLKTEGTKAVAHIDRMLAEAASDSAAAAEWRAIRRVLMLAEAQ